MNLKIKTPLGKHLRKCKNWPFSKNPKGYGIIHFGKKYKMAHRAIYEGIFGKIKKGLVLDHLCRNHACIKPTHLRVITIGENTRCGNSPNGINSRKTHCKYGHPFAGYNVYLDTKGRRVCRACKNKECIARYYANKALRERGAR